MVCTQRALGLKEGASVGATEGPLGATVGSKVGPVAMNVTPAGNLSFGITQDLR